MTELLDIIKQLIKAGFWGSLTIQFQAGRITMVKKEETIKLNSK